MGCARRLVALVVLVAVAGAAWYFKDDIGAGFGRFAQVDAPEGPSAELASMAEIKLHALLDGSSRRVTLSESELQSLLVYRYASHLGTHVDSPTIALRQGRVHLTARVPTRHFGLDRNLGDIASFLPETATVEVIAQIIPLDARRVGLAVDQLSAARVPLPARLVPGLLTSLGRSDEAGLPADALAIPLPPGASGAYIRDDSVVLISAAAAARTD